MRKDACRDKLSLSLSGSIADGQILGSLGRDEHLLAKLQLRKQNKNNVVLIMLFNESKGQSLGKNMRTLQIIYFFFIVHSSMLAITNKEITHKN